METVDLTVSARTPCVYAAKKVCQDLGHNSSGVGIAHQHAAGVLKEATSQGAVLFPYVHFLLSCTFPDTHSPYFFTAFVTKNKAIV